MSKKLPKNVESTAKFSGFSVLNENFTRCRCNIFYTGKNRNYTDITEEALQKLIDTKGYANVPVVAHLFKDKDGNYKVGGHDYKVEITNDGMEYIDETVPFGVIPEDCNPQIEEYTEKTGIVKKYFCVDLILWTHRYPIMQASYGDEIYFNQSMEISIEDYTYDGDYLVIKDFSLSALCLLNKSNGQDNVEPCFESSAVRKFSADIAKTDFKQNFSELLRIYNQSKTKKGDEKNVRNKLIAALSNVKYTDILGAETERYALVSVDGDTAGIFDRSDAKVYSVKFKEEGEDISFDFENMTECALTIAEKTDSSFNHTSEISLLCSYSAAMREAKLKEGISAQIKQLSEERKAESAKFAELQKQYNDVVAQLTQYQQAEQKRKNDEHRATVKALVDKYETSLRLSPDYIAYRSDDSVYEKPVEEVEDELNRMLGKFAKSREDEGDTYSPMIFGAQTLDFSFTESKKSAEESRYGNLLEAQRIKKQ